jgi:head-tail adaptor
MKAGELKHRIKVYSKNNPDDNCGGQIETFTLKGECWCQVSGNDPSGNDEQYHDRKIETINSYKIKTRFNIGFEFDQTDVIMFDTRLMRIQGITNIIEGDFRFSVLVYEIESDSVVIV